MSEKAPAKIVICASGAGTNFQALVEATRQGQLPAEIVGLIANRGEAGAIQVAKRFQIPTALLAPKDFATRSDWDLAMCDQLQKWKAQWVVLAGFLTLIGTEVLAQFPNRVVNIHPALLPQFGGPGMYGRKVHEAVAAAAANETGVTVHLVNAQYDKGHILAQKRVPVLAQDTPATIEARVRACELEFYPQVLADLVTGRITIG